MREVVSAPKEFLEALAKDPDVADWLISVTEMQRTRGEYLEYAGRFFYWAEWTPQQLFALKREAVKAGEPRGEVEGKLKRYHETLRLMGYAGKSRAKMIAAVYSLIQSKGYTIPRKLIRLDMSSKTEMRVPEQKEIDLFIQYAHGLEKKLLYTMLTDSPCRPRVFPALRCNWLEAEWWEKDVIHVTLPKQFRPGNQSGPRKFEPICFLGPNSIQLLKQIREAKIKRGKLPLDTEHILTMTSGAVVVAVRRDFNHLIQLGLIRPSRRDEEGKLIEQPLSPKSWRKYQFNIIDALTDISPEWRKMLKGRDLQTERYYSKENIEELRKVYRDKIQPRLWTNVATATPEELKALHDQVSGQALEIETLQQLVRNLAAKIQS